MNNCILLHASQLNLDENKSHTSAIQIKFKGLDKGGTVVFSPGIYMIASGFSLKPFDNTRIVLMDGCIIQSISGEGQDHQIFNLDGRNNISIEGLGIIKNFSSDNNQSGFVNGITAESCNNLTIRGITFDMKDSFSDSETLSSIEVNCVNNALIQNCTFMGGYYGISAKSCNNLTIRGITSDMKDSFSKGKTPSSIEANDVNNVLIQNCTFIGGYYGVRIFGGTYLRVFDNECFKQHELGINLVSDTKNIENAWIERNHCHQIKSDGIKLSVTPGELYFHRNVFILYNSCHDNSRDGIDVALHQGENIHIEGNIVYANFNYGIEFKLYILDELYLSRKDEVYLRNSIITNNIIRVPGSDKPRSDKPDNPAIGIGIAGETINNVNTDECSINYNQCSNITVSQNIIHCADITTSRGINVIGTFCVSILNNQIFKGKYCICLRGTYLTTVSGNISYYSNIFIGFYSAVSKKYKGKDNPCHKHLGVKNAIVVFNVVENMVPPFTDIIYREIHNCVLQEDNSPFLDLPS
ncbi:MAG: right-handed parallel beta-helix repeat-containing protein [Calothrix sp. MO_167.B12]|nr:right-handed parallel beta-helix repeat-containing protein [Calothrix sp. MO_167.B12]